MELINSVFFTLILILTAVENVKCQGCNEKLHSYDQENSTGEFPAPLSPSFPLFQCIPKRRWSCGSVGFNCTVIRGENECDKCLCEKLCPDITCRKGCQIYSGDPYQCPKCVCDTDRKCFRYGRYYSIGMKTLSQTYESYCRKCECRVPPDFTCIIKQCPPPPDEIGCVRSGRTEDHCCTAYKCPSDRTKTNYSMTITPSKSLCPHNTTLNCGSIGINCTKIQDENGCDKCLCDKLCSDLTDCGDGCHISSVNPDECPICVCNNETKKRCPDLSHCGEKCRIFSANPGECPKCSCKGVVCSTLANCGDGCRIFSVNPNECPRCSCKGILCPEVTDCDSECELFPFILGECPRCSCHGKSCPELSHCHEGCHYVSAFNECSKCVCPK